MRAKVSKYRSTAHVTPVSSICGQTNSISKYIMNDCRKQMDPSSLEMLMILKLNPDLWDKKTVNAVIRKSTEHETRIKCYQYAFVFGILNDLIEFFFFFFYFIIFFFFFVEYSLVISSS
jgi:hypothetical protein